MEPTVVYNVLSDIGVTHLHHANTVTTSTTFLENGGLLSRGYVESNGLMQTEQYSDDLDRQLGIWDRVFVDHVNIHFRGGRAKGPNQYGPVLFKFELNFLLQLPQGSRVLVTKSNPVHWDKRTGYDERWFQTANELRQKLSNGDFDKMLVIETANGRVDFAGGKPIQIALDDPNRIMISGDDAFDHAKRRLIAAGQNGGVDVRIRKHECRDGCVCVTKYGAYDAQYFDSRFK